MQFYENLFSSGLQLRILNCSIFHFLDEQHFMCLWYMHGCKHLYVSCLFLVNSCHCWFWCNSFSCYSCSHLRQKEVRLHWSSYYFAWWWD